MKTFIFFFFICFFSAAQNNIEGFIFDKTNNKPLPYAAIILGGSKLFTITNEDGKFEYKGDLALDSLEVRFIGYENRKVPITYFVEKDILFLTPAAFELDEVIVNSIIQDPYKVLNKVIKKYRKKESISKSKVFFSLNSSCKNAPIEQIEGFYNCDLSLSRGLINLNLKSGRFGQNKSYPFYSLDNASILKDFNFFKKANQILPSYPGNLSSLYIKTNYTVKFDECMSCKNNDILISFIPNKINGKLFSGKILFNKDELVIKKIDLWIKDKVSINIEPIDENDTVTIKDIHLQISFNPIDFEKVQYLDFNLDMIYNSQSSKKIIKTHSFLYFYDYNYLFEEPYFTNSISFKNDYDKIIALQASVDFWNINYQFPKSNDHNESMNFLKSHGNLYNYDNYIPTNATPYINHSVIAWNKNKPVEWKNVKKIYVSKSENFAGISKSNLRGLSKSHFIDESLNFAYVIDTYKNEKGINQFISRTLFDRNTSFYKKKRSKKALVYLNLIFDIYEFHRQEIEEEVKDNMSFEEAKKTYDILYLRATITVNDMKHETNFGSNNTVLNNWASKIKSKLNNTPVN